MKITAVIAEYNPFHNGHSYQLEEIRRTQGADYILVIMSGNFVQRGTPAVCDKFSRAKMALACGADAVLELPVYWSVSSAENFARGAVALLDALGCIDSMCFGCENPEIFTGEHPLLLHTADLLNKEPDSFRKLIAEYQKEGLSYPAAKTKALKNHLNTSDAADITPGKHPGLSNTANTVQEKTDRFLTGLNAPNNLLGFEYARAIAYFHSSIKAAPVLRKGSSYHEETILNKYPSSSALRRFLLSQELSYPDVPEDTSLCDPSGTMPAEAVRILQEAMPAEAVRILQEAMLQQPLLSENALSVPLHFTLLRAEPAILSDYYDCNEQIVRRILKHAGSFLPWTDFCQTLKTKNYTHTRISRCLLHILLGIKESDIKAAKSDGYVRYARILGFRDSAKPLLTAFKKYASVPLITNIGRVRRKLPEQTLQMLEADLHASDIYRCLAKHSDPQKILLSDYKNGVIRYKK
ncbi:MAG: nucleotidyltransferase family protein [Eubacterium sp.]|nr:nucleotidyltransferase family protein [Eubacterium sp.]